MELGTFGSSEPTIEDLSMRLRREIIEVILDANRNSERTLQVPLGPSEIGQPCDRRLAMSIMHEKELNEGGDPWPPIVGTAIHAWLEKAFTRDNKKLGYIKWLTEATIPIASGIIGHADLYHALVFCVLDHKAVGPDRHREYRKNGPGQQYQVQAHTYGKGFKNIGLPVEHVAIAFYPRGGNILSDKTGLYVWTEPFDETIADRALARVNDITEQCMRLDVERKPENYEAFEKTSGFMCRYCPFFNAGHIGPGCKGFLD